MDRTEASDAFNAGSIPAGCIFYSCEQGKERRKEAFCRECRSMACRDCAWEWIRFWSFWQFLFSKEGVKLSEEQKKTSEEGTPQQSLWSEVVQLLKKNKKSFAVVIGAAVVLLGIGIALGALIGRGSASSGNAAAAAGTVRPAGTKIRVWSSSAAARRSRSSPTSKSI